MGKFLLPKGTNHGFEFRNQPFQNKNGVKTDYQSPLYDPTKVGALYTRYHLFLLIVTTLPAQDFT